SAGVDGPGSSGAVDGPWQQRVRASGRAPGSSGAVDEGPAAAGGGRASAAGRWTGPGSSGRWTGPAARAVDGPGSGRWTGPGSSGWWRRSPAVAGGGRAPAAAGGGRARQQRAVDGPGSSGRWADPAAAGGGRASAAAGGKAGPRQ
ncbi:hypothetical protein CYMTET_11213, partial [Cymbomonas tetramitiformis]